MRKLIVFNMVSLDGYFAGPNGEIDWHNVDDEFNNPSISEKNIPLLTKNGNVYMNDTINKEIENGN